MSWHALPWIHLQHGCCRARVCASSQRCPSSCAEAFLGTPCYECLHSLPASWGQAAGLAWAQDSYSFPRHKSHWRYSNASDAMTACSTKWTSRVSAALATRVSACHKQGCFLQLLGKAIVASQWKRMNKGIRTEQMSSQCKNQKLLTAWHEGETISDSTTPFVKHGMRWPRKDQNVSQPPVLVRTH